MARLAISVLALGALAVCALAAPVMTDGEMEADDILAGLDDDIFAALDEDGECGASEDPATCALNALQLRASRQAEAQNATDEEDEEGGCSSGIVGKIQKAVPSCINPCKQACGPLQAAIHAYLTKGGAAAAKRAMCQYKSQFACLVTGAQARNCAPVAAKARSFGFSLPTSTGQLYSQCR